MEKHHGHHDDKLTEFQRALLDTIERGLCGLWTSREVLEAVRRIEAKQLSDSTTIERILVITQQMQDAADALSALTTQIAAGVETLIAGQGSGEGASGDEVVSLLSPIASSLQQVVDRINEAIGGGTPTPFAARRGPSGPARGPARRQ